MEEERTSYLYGEYTITTLRNDGVWWARARVSLKIEAGDRPVRGGPWKSVEQAMTAAQRFCDNGKARVAPRDADSRQG